MHNEPDNAPIDNPTALAARAVASGSAAIASLEPGTSGLAVAATGSFEAGIGRVDFVLVDLTGDPLTDVVDRKDVDYAKPPKQVAEAWRSSVALTAELSYRVFFQVYDRTGVNLVAYDRRDFTWTSRP
jgi:hypothetical protein